MASGLASLFPGVDLCTLPSGVPPEGQTSNLNNPTTLLIDLTIILTIIPTVLALVCSFGRLWANFKRRNWGDYLVLLAVLVAVAQNVLLITFVKYDRHMWDIPLCWINAQFLQVTTAYELMSVVGLLLAKTATLLLFHQLFQVSKQTRLAIRLGIIVNTLLYGSSFIILSYWSLPHVGETWDDLIVGGMLHPDNNYNPIKWGIGQASVSAALDIYIFILPIPTIVRLHLPSKKRIQLMAIFFTAVLGIVASLVSLAYRVKSLSDSDQTWITGVLMICNQAELAVAIIVSSMPGFASFMRTSVMESKLFSSIRSLFSSVITQSGSRGTTKLSKLFTINQRRPSSHPRQRKKQSEECKANEPWLTHAPYVVDIEDQPHPVQWAHEDYNARAQGPVDVKRLSCSDGSTGQSNDSTSNHVRPTSDPRGVQGNSANYELTDSLSVDSLCIVDN